MYPRPQTRRYLKYYFEEKQKIVTLMLELL